MVETKSLLKGAVLVVLALVVVRLALWLLGVVVSAVIWAIHTAIVLLALGLLLYGGYWLYTNVVADDESSRSREKLYER